MQSGGNDRVHRVLVVDDDASIRELITLALEDDGHEVLTASEGESALAMIPEVAPDVILLDTRMPVMDGHEFALRYQQQNDCRAPLIVLTALDDPQTTAEEIGADGYLPKPFDLSELTSVVNQYLKRED